MTLRVTNPAPREEILVSGETVEASDIKQHAIPYLRFGSVSFHILFYQNAVDAAKFKGVRQRRPPSDLSMTLVTFLLTSDLDRGEKNPIRHGLRYTGRSDEIRIEAGPAAAPGSS